MAKRAESGYWAMRAPVLSTAHLAAAVSEQLHSTLAGEEFFDTPCMMGSHGAMLYCSDIENLPEEAPQCMRDGLAWGKHQGFNWVRLNADGDVVAGLPEFIW
ncbi:hypothetical protein [uncultured Luteimonas sp.]|uniref:DUF5983 family protein n=1 Tax=uncultured Luteimonas sp. TaxID=453144 RepID=UPI0026119410|nr:hypothetical protein [uncultured Luteimonas sp.]